MRARRILFVAEAVTLAHVARCIVLARALDPSRHEVVFACDPRYASFVEPERWSCMRINSLSSESFRLALYRGKPVYDLETLQAYVDEDRALLAQVKPDLVVGDFRLSLSVSARLARVRYATVANAYWSPFFTGPGFPMPSLAQMRWLPLNLSRWMFDLFRPWAIRAHCKPLNRLRTMHGLPCLGSDLRRVYTDADDVLYADSPHMFPLQGLPASHRHLGPLLWSPPVARPDWWDELPVGLPTVYVCLGSSGDAVAFAVVMEALQSLPITVIVSSAGAPLPHAPHSTVFVAPYLPGAEAAARADLVICNGGSLATQQALATGVPVLGIASNMDQFLNMGAVVSRGAGLLMRADRVNPVAIRQAVQGLLSSKACREAAVATSALIGAERAATTFREWVDEQLPMSAGRSPHAA